jgi:hypothetical protein
MVEFVEIVMMVEMVESEKLYWNPTISTNPTILTI